MAMMLADLLAKNTKEGVLYKTLSDGRLECFACGHRCHIPEGRPGICKIRFNKDGKLYVPWGYVAGIQDDPIEKKPFFHAIPGARALSFGMLGCDYHCGYCFLPETRIATDQGPLRIDAIVEKRLPCEVYSHTGQRHKIENYFERLYEGPVYRIKPAFLSEVACTPEHPFLARRRPDRFPDEKSQYLEAAQLTQEHCLVIPKHYHFSETVVLKSSGYLQDFLLTYRVKRKIPAELLECILVLTEMGKSSREISGLVQKSPSHIRHLRSRIRKGLWKLEKLAAKQAVLIEKGGRIRFTKEHEPGIPSEIALNEALAELLGYYCAEGSVTRAKDRVHSAALNFSFSKKENDLARRTKDLIQQIFDVKAYLVKRATTVAVATKKTSLALLFEGLCGHRGSRERVPAALFRSNQDTIRSFLKAYVAGDGYRAPDGHVRISTISEELAWGVAWLVQKLGYLPQFYRYANAPERELLGRKIKQAPWVYLVRWYEAPKKQRHVWEDEQYRYVLIEKIAKTPYTGKVYNLETEKEHTYLANLTAVHNCQNWGTSQALRDPVAGTEPVFVTPPELIKIALDRRCEVLTSTYNEPLITSEWAAAIFQEAKKAGLVTSYVSNGNGTPEVIDYIAPWVDLYKVDLKSFDDKHYRELGGTLERVKETIRNLHQRKIWLEVLTLLIPGFNDGDEELAALIEFLASVSVDIPWHVTAFHKDYKMMDPANTTAKDLLRASAIGRKAGLRYIYPGNLPGQVGEEENTFCPSCRGLLIRRFGFQVLEDCLTPTNGRCPDCKTLIPGFWKKPALPRRSDGFVRLVI